MDVSRKILVPPTPGVMTEEKLLDSSEEPGRALYRRLKELAEKRGHEIRWTQYSFGYYLSFKGERFCLLSVYPNDIYIHKWILNPRKGVTKEAAETFEREMKRIGTLVHRYDTMKQPKLSTREGDLSTEEVEGFISAVEALDDSIQDFKMTR